MNIDVLVSDGGTEEVLCICTEVIEAKKVVLSRLPAARCPISPIGRSTGKCHWPTHHISIHSPEPGTQCPEGFIQHKRTPLDIHVLPGIAILRRSTTASNLLTKRADDLREWLSYLISCVPMSSYCQSVTYNMTGTNDYVGTFRLMDCNISGRFLLCPHSISEHSWVQNGGCKIASPSFRDQTYMAVLHRMFVNAVAISRCVLRTLSPFKKKIAMQAN